MNLINTEFTLLIVDDEKQNRLLLTELFGTTYKIIQAKNGVQALEKARQHPHFQWVEGSWVLEDNTPVNDLLEDFSGQLTKRYRLYRREIQS